MKRITLAAVALASSLAFAPGVVAKKPKLDPPDPSRGIIGVSVKVIPPAKIGYNYADAVYFVRVNEDSDRFAAENFIPSNYVKGKNVYLLNAKPGRYVAVGCLVQQAGNGFVSKAVFSQNDILQTEVEVMAGTPVYMGEIETGSSTKIDRADSAQAHYLRLIAPGTSEKNFFSRAMSGGYVYTAAFKSIVRDKAAATAFWLEADAKHFDDEPEWKRFIAPGYGAGSPAVAVASAAAPAGATAPADAAPAAAAPAAAALPAATPAAASAAASTTIPKQRLRDGVYSSPGGEFTLKVPSLIEPGAKSDERQLGPGAWAVSFIDDFGHVYYVLRSDNREPRKTLEEITSDIQLGGAVRSKETVTGARGAEVRVTGVVRNGSPLEARTEGPGKPGTVTRLDLVKASSLFLHLDNAYEVTVGITRLHGEQTDDELLTRAKTELETFLSGLVLQAP